MEPRPHRIRHTGLKGVYSNKLFIRVLLVIEFILGVCWTVGLGLTLKEEKTRFRDTFLFVVHYAAPAVAAEVLRNIRDCESGRCRRNSFQRFVWFMLLYVALVSDVFSTIEHFMHMDTHTVLPYHYLMAFVFIAGATLDLLYLGEVIVFWR